MARSTAACPFPGDGEAVLQAPNVCAWRGLTFGGNGTPRWSRTAFAAEDSPILESIHPMASAVG